MGNEKMKNNQQRSMVIDFINLHSGVAYTLLISVLICLLAVFSQAGFLPIPARMEPWRDFILNVLINVIAAIVFFIVEVFIPNDRKERVIRRYARRFVEERLLLDCRLFLTRTERLLYGDAKEEDVLEPIAISCQSIRSSIGECMRNYAAVLPEEMVDAINGLLYDDMFFMISKRTDGSLTQFSLEDILADREGYKNLCGIMHKIEEGVQLIPD